MIKYIIVDDEPIAHRIIETFGKDLPFLELQSNNYSALEAMSYLHGNTIDLMILDINMPKMKGLDFLKILKNPPKVIITSAYEEYALQGYELNVVDYLLKPFSFERYAQAINKVIDQQPVIQVQEKNTNSKEDSIFLKGDKQHHQVQFNNILIVESIGSYCKVITRDGSIVTHEKISNFENLLPSSDFIRVHKSFIVAKKGIRSIQGNRILIESVQIPIGQTYKMNVNKLLK